MKLSTGFLLHNVDGETYLVPVGNTDFSGMVRGNKTFGAIVELLQNECSEEELIAAMKERFDAPKGAIERDVARVLSELRNIGAIDG